MTSLSWAQVSAWRLAQHYLAKRAARANLLDVVTGILGLHAQMMSAAELQMWARVRGATPPGFQNTVWNDRKLVKTWAMRGTLHLLPAHDYGLYIAALSTRENWRSGPWLKYFNITLAQMEALNEAVRDALDGRCLTREELASEVARITGQRQNRELLLSGWGSFLKPAASLGYLCFGPSQGQSVTFVRPDKWIGPWKSLKSSEAVQELLRRYLAAYGPATRDDFARWLGVSPAPKIVTPVFEAMDSHLQEVRVEDWKGYALSSTVKQIGAMKEQEAESVRLLPNFDLFINLNYPHRRFMLDPRYTERVYRKSAWVSPVVLVNGHMMGVWSYAKKRSKIDISIDLFEKVTPATRDQIEVEASYLGDYFGMPVELSYIQ